MEEVQEQKRAGQQRKHQQKDDLQRLEDGYGNINVWRDAQREYAGDAEQCDDDFCEPHHGKMVERFSPDCKVLPARATAVLAARAIALRAILERKVRPLPLVVGRERWVVQTK